MYIIMNALQNLARNRGRNLMIGGIIFVIIVSVVTALMIHNTADSVIDDYKTRFGSEVSFVPNMQKMREQATENAEPGHLRIQLPTIDPEDLIEFGQSDYLKEAVFTADSKGNSEQLKPIDEEMGGGGGPMLRSSNGPAQSMGRQYFHRLLGDEYADFEDGLRELTEGSRFPESAGECIISQELLENSGLSIGDDITVTSALESADSVPGEEEYTDISWDMTIVGTYDDITDEYGEGRMENAFSNRRNEIITTFETLADKMTDGLIGINVDSKYYLKNPDMLDAFTEEVYAKGLDEMFNVTTDSASYDAVVAPVEGLKGISVTFVIIVLAFGAIILALLASIAIRERKYEIGVLRAMGMKKLKVVAGLWTETLAITCICLILGLGAGMVVAQPVTDVMLDRQIAAAENAANNNNMIPGGMVLSTEPMRGFAGQSNAEPLKNLHVSLDALTVLEIAGIALLLSSLSGMISTRKITKYEPIKILMERN
jgi:putative ABC transport system permease protein